MADVGGCDPRPGKAGLSQGLAELFFGVFLLAAGAGAVGVG